MGCVRDMPKNIFGKYAPKLILIGSMFCVTAPSAFAANGWNLYGDQPSYFVHYGDGETDYALAHQSMLGLKVEVNGVTSTIGSTPVRTEWSSGRPIGRGGSRPSDRPAGFITTARDWW